MSCGNGGKTKYSYTGNQVGYLNHTGFYNFCAGGAGLSASTTAGVFIPNTLYRRPWEAKNAVFNEQLLDATYPVINLQWFAEIQLTPDVIFRISDRAFYVQDKEGLNRYYDARAERAPQINVTVGEWLSPNSEIGDVTITLNNRDGLYNEFLPLGVNYRQWSGASVVIKVGFGEKYSNYFTLFEGKVTEKEGLTTDRDSINIKAYDKFDLDEVPIPARTFSLDTFPDVDDSFKGKAIPLIYGDWSEEVPEYGSLSAACINANEDSPDRYLFKVSDIALKSLDGVYLHRGNRVVGSAAGPLRIADNQMTVDLDAAEFSIPSTGIILDDPYYLAERIKCGPGTSVDGMFPGIHTFTTDNGFNFIASGIKVGDSVVNGAPTAAKVVIENLEYTANVSDSLGNIYAVEYYLLPASFVDTDGNSRFKCYATLLDETPMQITARVGITQYTDGNGDVQIGIHTADAIKAAINSNAAVATKFRVKVVGTVPSGYPNGSRPGDVRQTVPQGPTFCVGGTDATKGGLIASVSAFQMVVLSPDTWNAGDEYSISTQQFSFLKGDKFSVVCRGKDLANLSVARLSDTTADITRPTGLYAAFDSTFWIADDDSQKIYNLSHKKEVLQTVDYADIDPSITSVSAVSVGADAYLWVVDPTQSTIFRYNYQAGALDFLINTATVTGLMATLANVTGIAVQSDNLFWIVDQATGNFYQIDAFSSTNPLVTDSFDSTFEPTAIDIQDLAYDEPNDQLIVSDRATNRLYRLDTDGNEQSSLDLTQIADNVSNVTGVSVAQDGTLLLVDQSTLSVYNYNDLDYAFYNPCFIARDILTSAGAHTYDDFDLSWNQTARQMSSYKARAAISSNTTAVTFINTLLKQFNVVFHFRFNKYALFWITFENFRTSGKLVKEKDFQDGTFHPGKETSQYFNSAKATYGAQTFDSSVINTSDTYVSNAGISFNGREVNRVLDMPNIYRRQELDEILPLLVRLSVPDPEFIDVTCGFRMIRAQMQDFLTVEFDSDVDPVTGKKIGGRRYDNVPAMVRKMTYDLGPMTVQFHLWSLGTTAFDGYVPPGNTVGGQHDQIVLSSVGRAGRVSPNGTITGTSARTITLSDVDGQDAESRTEAPAGLAWAPGYKLALMDGVTKEVIQIFTIEEVSGQELVSVEDFVVTPTITTKNSAGFITGGHYIQYAPYSSMIEAQRLTFASLSKPLSDYPTTRTQELEEQRAGAHNFADGGSCYILYPVDFISY